MECLGTGHKDRKGPGTRLKTRVARYAGWGELRSYSFGELDFSGVRDIFTRFVNSSES